MMNAELVDIMYTSKDDWGVWIMFGFVFELKYMALPSSSRILHWYRLVIVLNVCYCFQSINYISIFRAANHLRVLNKVTIPCKAHLFHIKSKISSLAGIKGCSMSTNSESRPLCSMMNVYVPTRITVVMV